MPHRRTLPTLLGLLAALSCLCLAAPQPAAAQTQTRLKNICRVKGQEENTLHGLGLVVGLPGTGDGGSFLPAIRSLAMAMQLMGNPLGQKGTLELKDAKNIALVAVTARVPAAGARQGDRIDCQVASVGAAKSLAGGRLFITPLQGPQVGDGRVYAFASGPVVIEEESRATTGRIHDGCQLEEDFLNPFTKDGHFTLVLHEDTTSFHVAQEIADLVNSQLGIYSQQSTLAKAVNPQNIMVRIPAQYQDDPVSFIAQVLSLQMVAPQVEARVVINERTGSIVISGDAMIGAVVVTHKNLVIEANGAPRGNSFVALQTGEATTELRSLVEALNAVKLPSEDIIEIVKRLQRTGKLHARLIVE